MGHELKSCLLSVVRCLWCLHAALQLTPAITDNGQPTTDHNFHSPNCRAACSVFRMSMAMVIGPTPPGTGVMAAHKGATS